MSVQGMGPQGEKVVVQEGGVQLLDKHLRVSWTLGGRCRREVKNCRVWERLEFQLQDSSRV